jgi:hypothetical protein
MPNANTYLAPAITIPGTLLITNITTTNPMVVTFTNSVENTYVVGQVVFLTVPSSYKMFQANGRTGQITAINGNQFTLDIDATQFDTFVVPATYQPQPASLSPAGSRNLQYSNFTNQVAFQNLNNTGN